MTDRPHTPIYTSRELAELLAEHDHRYPKHGNDCSCRHGLITAARVLFASTERPAPRVMFEPRRYVPPDVLRGTTARTGGHDALLDRLGRRGAMLHAFQVDRHGPEILAVLHDWGGTADVVILFDQERAVAYRTPTGPDIDMFSPEWVYWSYAAGPVWTLRAFHLGATWAP